MVLLKVYLSFDVVNAHCLDVSNYPNHLKFFLMNDLHVPTFFIISFYFFHKSLISRNTDKLKQRFQRLLIPYIVWPIIIFVINNIFFYVFKIQLYNSFNDLQKQLLTGHCFILPLWFQWDLIFVTFLFVIIELLLHKYMIIILIIIEILSYFLQYSNYNYNFCNCLMYDHRFTFGRLMEILPFSISGFVIAYFELISILKKRRTTTVIFCIIIFCLSYKYNLIIEPLGFRYQGVKIHIQSLCLFIFFSIISIDFLSHIIKKIIKQISSLSPGIYFLHYPLKRLFNIIFISVKNNTIYGSIFIYIMSYLICYIGNKFLMKTKLRNLFQ